MGREAFVPLPSALSRVSTVRGSMVGSSLSAARELGLESRYFEALNPAHVDTIRELVVSSWVPADVVTAHYEAMNSLGLRREQQVEIGRRVADRVQNSWAGTNRPRTQGERQRDGVDGAREGPARVGASGAGRRSGGIQGRPQRRRARVFTASRSRISATWHKPALRGSYRARSR